LAEGSVAAAVVVVASVRGAEANAARCRMRHVLVALLLACIVPWGAAAEGRDVRNVVLIIGDGMDEQQITIARNYLMGPGGRLELDRLPVRGNVLVLTVDEDDPRRPVYVADSANSATAMATGVVTSRGRLATRPGREEPIATIVELAQRAGLATGIVTTSSVTDATPAAFMAHINRRFCHNPNAMIDVEFKGVRLGDCDQYLKSAGGPGSISEQIAVSGVDVVLGGGQLHFEPPVEGGGPTVRALAAANGYHVVDKAADLAAVPAKGRLLGLFAPDDMPVRLRGEGGRVAEMPEPSLLNKLHQYLGSVSLPEPMGCEDDPAFAGMPTLEAMTEVALSRLSMQADGGFFLMIESASIDKQAHRRSACGSIGELAQLDEALDSVLAFAEAHPQTLVLVTADHGHAAQIVPNGSLFDFFGIPVYTPGQLVRLEMPHGGVMAINYATNGFAVEEHTGTAVPIFTNEVGRALLPPTITQPELFGLMTDYLGLSDE
jgi:alkaline phosphatase